MTTDDLRHHGFLGGIPVSAICVDIAVVPDVPGVYVLARVAVTEPVFLPASLGRVGRRGDPRVAPEILASNWVEAAEVVYIGKAAGRSNGAALRTRLREYNALRSGLGRQPLGRAPGLAAGRRHQSCRLLEAAPGPSHIRG